MGTDPHRGWLAPNGDYHGLSDSNSPGSTFHAGWVERNSSIHGLDKNTHPHDNMEALVAKGWVMKRGKYSSASGVNKDGTKWKTPAHILFRVDYDNHPDALDRIRDHMKEHHPDHKFFGIQGIEYEHEGIYNVNEGREWRPVKVSDRGWLSPHGEYHDFGGGFQTHGQWARSNRHLIPKEDQLCPETGRDENIDRNMVDAGWIQKRGKSPSWPMLFHAHDADDPGIHSRIRAHMREHHPDETHFEIQDDKYSSATKMPVHESMVGGSKSDTSERGWISHTDEFHPMFGFEIHNEWAQSNLDQIPKEHHAANGRHTLGRMLGGGWIMKRGRTPIDRNHPITFTTGDDKPETVERVRAHMKEHHPEEEKFGLGVRNGWRQLLNVNESRADQLITCGLVEGVKPKHVNLRPYEGGFEIVHKEHGVVGTLEGEAHDAEDGSGDTHFRVDSVDAEHPKIGGSNGLGPAAVRKLSRQLKRHTGASRIWTNSRSSGTRLAAHPGFEPAGNPYAKRRPWGCKACGMTISHDSPRSTMDTHAMNCTSATAGVNMESRADQLIKAVLEGEDLDAPFSGPRADCPACGGTNYTVHSKKGTLKHHKRDFGAQCAGSGARTPREALTGHLTDLRYELGKEAERLKRAQTIGRPSILGVRTSVSGKVQDLERRLGVSKS